MRTKLALLFAAALMLVISTATLASNMGFKISLTLVTGSRSNWVSLPYFVSYQTSTDVRTDLANAGYTGVVVSRYDAASGIYTNDGGRNPFPLVPGEGLLIRVASGTGPWIVVGSHDPTKTFSLVTGSRSNWVSIPYHTTATSSTNLRTELTAAGYTGVVVSRYDAATGIYTNDGGRNPFALVIGEAVLIRVATGPASGGWTPAHY